MNRHSKRPETVCVSPSMFTHPASALVSSFLLIAMIRWSHLPTKHETCHWGVTGPTAFTDKVTKPSYENRKEEGKQCIAWHEHNPIYTLDV